jgi:SAM-dependent methyltransferase
VKRRLLDVGGRVLRVLLPGPARAAGYRLLAAASARGAPEQALRELLGADAALRLRIDQAAIAYESGVHPKHRLMRYHDFFVDRVRPGERVLDVGCGKGELAFDLAERAGADVTGVDLDAAYLAFARDRFRHERLRFVEGDALADLPPGGFDVVVLSNVLEHIAPRVELLRRLLAEARPDRLLLRVPLYTRDWTVPLRSELGLPAYGDLTHEIEYDVATFDEELRAAGLERTELVVDWGEIWAVARPLRRD